jgi:transcriptional regulator with XRE-family HTH domain
MSTEQQTLHPLIVQLRDIAEARHLTQIEIADELNVSERTVSYWFTTDTVPQKRHRRAILKWLDKITAEQSA